LVPSTFGSLYLWFPLGGRSAKELPNAIGAAGAAGAATTTRVTA